MKTKTDIKETLNLITSILTFFSVTTTGLSRLIPPNSVECSASTSHPKIVIEIQSEKAINHGKFSYISN